MSIANVRSALVKAYEDLALGVPTAYENRKFDPVGNEMWIDLTFLPTVPEAVTLGEGGLDEMLGIFQLAINVEEGVGQSEALALADTLRNSFTAGKIFAYLGQEVLIVNAGINPALTVRNYFRIPVSVIWRSCLVRAAL